MSQLRASINFSLRKKELLQNKIDFLDSNSSPVESDFNLQITDNNTTEDLHQNHTYMELDDEITGNESDIITSERWERELNVWEELLKEEEKSRLEEEEALRNNPSDSFESDLLSEYKHPAVDKKAKWELKTLFSSNISIPNYLILTE